LDNLLHIWDARKRRESPCIRINSSASAGKVAWEKTCGNILASTHENQLRVWDIRSRTDTPLGIYINRETDLGVRSFDDSDFCNARNRRILSIDFSPKRKNVIVTGSADSVVRVFEVNKSTTDAADVIFQVIYRVRVAGAKKEKLNYNALNIRFAWMSVITKL
jgi:WD40 repeat protein